MDCFERREYKRGETVLRRGYACDQIAILRMGELVTNEPDSTLPEIGGFAFFGEDCLRVSCLIVIDGLLSPHPVCYALNG